MTATIFDIKHFAVHDGPGIRTTVFFKGCPLRCLWCHNPEGLLPHAQLSYLPHKCVGCRRCETVCVKKAHTFDENGHTLSRSACTQCGACANICRAEALSIYGRRATVDELLDEVMEDADFYGARGGVTLSGGECLMQADACAELLRRLKELKIHTAIDTCGYVKREVLEKVLPYTDLFLYDVKAFDEDVHVRCTGVSNRIILDNLRYLDECGKLTVVRIPYVPGCNDNQIDKIGQFLAPLRSVGAVEVLPYHNYAKSKYHALDLTDTSPDAIPSDEDIGAAKKILKQYGLHVK